MKKRILSVLLTLVMLIGMLPTAVFAAETTYDLWVGDVRFTSGNLVIDSADDPAITGGSATYDPSTDIITLDNFNYTGAGHDYGWSDKAAIYGGNKYLTIKVIGENKITCKGDGYCYGIRSESGVSILGTDAENDKLTVIAEAQCIAASTSLHIEDVDLSLVSDDWRGIDMWGSNIIAEVIDSIVSIKCSDQGIYMNEHDDNGSFTVENSIITIDTQNSTAIDCSNISIKGAACVLAGDSESAATYANPTDNSIYQNAYVKIVNKNPKNLSVTRDGVTEYYDSLGSVWDDLEDGDVIKVEHDYIETYADVYAELYDSISYTIDLNGNEIHFPEDGYWEDAYWTDVGYFQPSGILTLTDSVGGGFMHAMVDARYADSLAVTGGTYVALFAPTDTKLSGGTFTGMPQEAVDAMMEDPYQAQFAKMIGTKSVLHSSFFDLIDNEEDARAYFDSIFADGYKANKEYEIYETLSGYYLVGLPANTTVVEAYKVTLVYGEEDKETKVEEASKFTEPDPRRISGKIFIGWYDDAELTALHDFSTGLTKHITLYAKYADYEDDKAELNDAIDALETAVDNVKTALDNKVSTDKLTEEIGKLNQAIAEAKTYADTQDAALKTTLEAADATMNAAITELQNRVTALEAGLTTANGNINTNTGDITALKTDVSDLKAWKTEAQNAIIALQNLTNTQDTNISALQTAVADLQTAVNTANDKITAAENRIAALEDKVSELETAKQELDAAVATLNAAIANKADTATLNQKVGELNTAIAKAEATAKEYTDGVVKNLRAAIIAAKDEAVNAAKDLVDAAKAELQAAIDNKADVTTVNTAIANLQNAITALQNAKDNYIAADAALKAELEDAIAKAKQEAIDAAKGYIPHIGTNGNWWIGDNDTGVDANGIKGDTGATGAQGPQGEKGDKGDTGAAGAAGVGIAKIEKTSSDGNVDTYTITLTNGTTYTFTVTNGTNGTDGKDGANGKDGVDGKDGTNGTNGVDGKDGTDGEDGQTPYIGENGNWWIGDTDTGVKAAGDDGKDGAITVATAVGGTALTSNIALIAWTLIKKKRLF